MISIVAYFLGPAINLRALSRTAVIVIVVTATTTTDPIQQTEVIVHPLKCHIVVRSLRYLCSPPPRTSIQPPSSILSTVWLAYCD